MNLFLRGAACAPLLALVAGCCANSPNTCDDLYADSLYFQFDTGPNGFTKAELDTVYLQRYTPARAAIPANGATPAVAATAASYSDPINIIRAKQGAGLTSGLRARLKKASLGDSTLVISNNSPFSPSVSGGKLTAYRYLLTVQNKPVRPGHTYQFAVDSIQLKGRYNADGCTTCYENTFKYFQINSKSTNKVARDVTEKNGESITAQDGSSVATVLSKSNAVVK
ncbi:hypothetical protein GKZ68_09520 [Hymenobacter sp. BRD128]|uniref:hypothetical protein n=1 Tax=Hymenobacter sp. BRD128 TaxID=2675878 RepID=UPI0015662892|nr:hypothetical protein [Hymenobacter sp. BRD128]QKG56841.1 hypothetical protein GKZ68_09520 [Hymenobacter sp. BRD128]